MAEAKIFLVHDDQDTPVELEECGYVTESELQKLLAKHTSLLPGDQIDPEDPRRWHLVGREVGIPSGKEEGDWWSVDHLFLDQDGIPTFVECKRSSDARGRRLVVAQMLDYAANGTEFWTADRLRQRAAEEADGDLDEAIRDFTGATAEDGVDAFWRSVEDRLRRGEVRLIFVTDRAPKELVRLAEFLNEQMRDTEVLVVEVKQFKAGSQRVLVPRLVGRPERSRPSGAPKLTSEEQFMQNCNQEARPFFTRVIADSRAAGHIVQWGTVGFSVRRIPPDSDKPSSFVYCYPPNQFEFYFGKRLTALEGKEKPLRKRLLEDGVLSEGGERTLRARLSGEQLSRAGEMWARVLSEIAAVNGRTTASDVSPGSTQGGVGSTGGEVAATPHPPTSDPIDDGSRRER